jgi:hypothetical protein
VQNVVKAFVSWAEVLESFVGFDRRLGSVKEVRSAR